MHDLLRPHHLAAVGLANALVAQANAQDRLARAQPGWDTVPVVMLTAKTQERDIVRALDAGATDYILKPFQPNELLARLRRFTRPRP